jgi:hypothetical protein
MLSAAICKSETRIGMGEDGESGFIAIKYIEVFSPLQSALIVVSFLRSSLPGKKERK